MADISIETVLKCASAPGMSLAGIDVEDWKRGEEAMKCKIVRTMVISRDPAAAQELSRMLLALGMAAFEPELFDTPDSALSGLGKKYYELVIYFFPDDFVLGLADFGMIRRAAAPAPALVIMRRDIRGPELPALETVADDHLIWGKFDERALSASLFYSLNRNASTRILSERDRECATLPSTVTFAPGVSMDAGCADAISGGRPGPVVTDRQPETEGACEAMCRAGIDRGVFDCAAAMEQSRIPGLVVNNGINAFISSFSKNIPSLRKAFENGNLEKVRTTAGIMRKAAGNAGAVELREVLEGIGSAETPDIIWCSDRIMEELEAGYRKYIAEVAKLSRCIVI